jgi:outer membrane biosynthesis protein TonB
MKSCKSCGATYEDRVDFCFQDGTPLVQLESSAEVTEAVDASAAEDAPEPSVEVTGAHGLPAWGMEATEDVAEASVFEDETVELEDPTALPEPMGLTDAPNARPEVTAPEVAAPEPPSRLVQTHAEVTTDAPSVDEGEVDDTTTPDLRGLEFLDEEQPFVIGGGIDDGAPSKVSLSKAVLASLGVVGVVGGVVFAVGSTGSQRAAQPPAVASVVETETVEALAEDEAVGTLTADADADADAGVAEDGLTEELPGDGEDLGEGETADENAEPAEVAVEAEPEPEPEPVKKSTRRSSRPKTAKKAKPAPVAAPVAVPKAAPVDAKPQAVAEVGGLWGMEPEVQTGSFVINSAPSGAHLYVDDVLVGQTQVTTKPMDYGMHYVKAQLDGYRSESRPVDLRSPQVSVPFELKPLVIRGTVLLIGPPGAQCFVDGNPGPKLPGSISVSEGTHTFRVVMLDGSSFTRTQKISFTSGGKPPRVQLTPQ